MKRSSLILLVATFCLETACATDATSKTHATSPAPPAAAAPKATAAPVPSPSATPGARGATPSLGDGIQWFRGSAEYRAIAISTYRNASEAVTNAVKGKARDSWAVVLDTDETVLDNSVFQRDLARGNAPFTEELWAVFVRRHVSEAVPGARGFLEHVKDLGGQIVIVTNRWSNLCEDTKENFRLQRLPFDVILCRIDTGDKNPRFASVASGAAFADGKAREAVAFIGDNIQDFPSLNQTLRDQPDSAFEAFGKRFFVLPNPMYGSWQATPPR